MGSRWQRLLGPRDSTAGGVALLWQEGKPSAFPGLGREAELRAEGWEGKLGAFRELQGCRLQGLARAGVGAGLEAPRRVTYQNLHLSAESASGHLGAAPLPGAQALCTHISGVPSLC